MQFPDWLSTPQSYAPPKGRDLFIDRSILGFLAVLAKARPRSGRRGTRPRAGLQPLVKILFLLATVLLASLSRSPAFLALVGAGFLVILAFQPGERIAGVVRTMALVSAFTVLILLPSALLGHLSSLAMTATKIVLSSGSAKLVAESTEWSSLSGAFKRLGVNDLFILVLDITLHYIVLLGRFALAMFQSLKLRSVGRNPAPRAALSGIAGTLFLKSKEMAEEMYGAMECRGFTGAYRPSGSLRLGFQDCLACAATCLLAWAFFVTRTR